ncbi:MAG: IS66 family insertion sequence element accessory protein TnpB [Hespellia sp.]|nr:IS66 family insertion sequence element accessory protein TnpB [Hespellia sp.]
MLNDAVCFEKIYIVTGYTDLRFGIDSLAAIIESKPEKKPFVPNTLYLFCGRRTDRIKGLVWESDGYLLLYKRLEQGNFQWPRSESEVRNLSQQQFRWLMEGLTVAPKKAVKQVNPPEHMA